MIGAAVTASLSSCVPCEDVRFCGAYDVLGHCDDSTCSFAKATLLRIEPAHSSPYPFSEVDSDRGGADDEDTVVIQIQLGAMKPDRHAFPELHIDLRASAPIPESSVNILFDGEPASCSLSPAEFGYGLSMVCSEGITPNVIEVRVGPRFPVFWANVYLFETYCTHHREECPG